MVLFIALAITGGLIMIALLIAEARLRLVNICGPFYILAAIYTAYSTVFYAFGKVREGLGLALLSLLLMLIEAEEYYTIKTRKRW